ncbi:hypothetical protein BHM03_00010646 [Ensete ventricosum]|nr:hypothetical protein BHM03_00010646 [Ensete ventricosum]
MHVPSELDVISSDSTDSVREQLHQVNQWLDEVQREFVKSKEKIDENSKGGSPFIPKMQDTPVSTNFRLLALEPYDDSSDPSEHIATFRAQMALYDTLDSLISRSDRDPEITFGSGNEVYPNHDNALVISV